MPRFRPKVLERSAGDDLWKHTLSRIPSIYGRITYLASLRDPNSGTYRHHGLTASFGREETANALQECHEEAFKEWLSLSLAEKNDDLLRYLATLDDPRDVVVNHWLKSRVHRSQPPSSALELERDLFCNDLEALLQMLRDDAGDYPPAATSSLHS